MKKQIKFNNERIVINEKFRELTLQLQSYFFNLQDFESIYESLGLDKTCIPDISTEDSLTIRQEFYENKINTMIENFENKRHIKECIKKLKIEIAEIKTYNEQEFASLNWIDPKTKKLIHLSLEYFEDFLNEVLTGEKQDSTHLRIVKYRQESHSVLSINQKVVLVYYLTKVKPPFFPSLTTGTGRKRGDYFVCLAKLFNDNGDRIKDLYASFPKTLQEFRVQYKKNDNPKKLSGFSPRLFDDVMVIKKWLVNIGREDVIKLINEDFFLPKK